MGVFWRKGHTPLPGFLQRSEDNPGQHIALRLFLLEGLLSGAANAYVDTFLPLFALALGAGAGDLGLMAAVSHVLGPVTYLAGGYLAERSGRHKRLYVVAEGLLGRGFFLLYPLVPWFFEARAAVLVLIGLHVVRMTFFRLAAPAQMAVTGRVAPAPLRGRFMSARSLVAGLGELGVQPLAGLLIAWLLFPRGYQLGFALAWSVGVAGIYAFARMPLPPPQAVDGVVPRQPLGGWGQDIATDRRLSAFLLVVLVWGMGEQVVRPFYSAHMVRNLGLSAGTIGFLGAASSLASLVGLPLVGLLSDRTSSRQALVATGIVLALAQLLWWGARSAWQLVPAFLLTGLASRAFQVVLLTVLLAIARPQRYARYSALHQAVATTTAVLGPLLGGYLFERVGFASNLILAAGTGLAAMAIAWRALREGEPVPVPT